MIKVIDIDELFNKYIEGFVYKNIGKVKPEEIENKIPELYQKFGDEKLSELDGFTPNTYYAKENAITLIDCLKQHLIKGVDVSDFLCEAITDKKDEVDVIFKELDGEHDEVYLAYLLNFISDMNVEINVSRYLEFVLYDYSENVSEIAVETLCKHADKAKEEILSQFNVVSDDNKVKLVEILSYAEKDDRVFDILISEFCKHQENIPLYCSFLSKYGDERALPFLLKVIEDEKINYADFEELRFTIEALGGEYTKERDFSRDKIFKKVKGNKPKNV